MDHINHKEFSIHVIIATLHEISYYQRKQAYILIFLKFIALLRPYLCLHSFMAQQGRRNWGSWRGYSPPKISRFKYTALRLAPQLFSGLSAVAPLTFSTFWQACKVYHLLTQKVKISLVYQMKFPFSTVYGFSYGFIIICS